jgi:transposase InsO family protein
MPRSRGKRRGPLVNPPFPYRLGPVNTKGRLRLVISVEVKGADGGTRTERALIDSGAEANCINQSLAVDCGWKPNPDLAEGLTTVDGRQIWSYGQHNLPVKATDTGNATRTVRHSFVACNLELGGPEILLGYPWLEAINPSIDWATGTWQYRKLGNINIVSASKFRRELENPQLSCVVMRPDRTLTETGRRIGVLQSGNPIVLPTYLEGYRDVFDPSAAAMLPEHHAMEHKIELIEGKEPPWGPVYALSEPELEELREYLESATKQGRIRRSISPAGAPIMFVPKKGGGLRLCVDYRGLNQITVKNRTPLPLISETLDRLEGAKVFTKLDLADAYNRLRIRKGDEWKTAFRTRYGHFEYLVMPFGLSNAPATFQAYINQALIGLVDVTCVIYLDDILIYSANPERHETDVKEVLDRLRQHKLYAKLKKCEFGVKNVEFLGFIVSTTGIAMDPERISTIRDWPVPKSVKDLQVFLGFSNFYRRFIEGYSKIARPLTDLLRKDATKGPFVLTEEAVDAFAELRRCFTTAPMLSHFDPSLRTRTETDASMFAAGGVLSQLNGEIWHPVAFYSHKFSPAEQNYETHDQELLAIVLAFKIWSHYLRGARGPVTVRTDHDNLKYFMTKRKLNGRQARWTEALAEYDFVIEYRTGKSNPADGLSRRPDLKPENGAEFQDGMLPSLQAKLLEGRRSDNGRLTVFGRLTVSVISEGIRHPRTGWNPGSGDRQDATEGDEITCEKQGPNQNRSVIGQEPAYLETDRFKPATGATGCKQYVPRSVAALLLASETAYGLPTESLRDAIYQLQQKDAFVIEMHYKKIPQRKKAAGTTDNWTMDSSNLLRYKGAVYVPNEASIRAEILSTHHDDPYAGHFGFKRTLELIQRKYYWQQLRKHVKMHVRTCEVCQRTKTKRHKPYGELAPLPVPNRPWQELTMDFITSLPPSKWRGRTFDSILVIVDRFSKTVRYIAVTKTITAQELADIYVSNIWKDFGTPEGITTDRGSQFTSEFWGAVMWHLQVRRRFSTAFHPQTDGQTERQNQVIEHYLRTYCDYRQDDWAPRLALAEFTYNNSVHESTGLPPFKVLYGFLPELGMNVGDDAPKGRAASTAEERIKTLHMEREELADRLRRASASQKKYYDKRHTKMEYKVGDLVMLATKNLRQMRPNRKLSDRYLGPFEVVEIVGNHKQAYRIKLGPEHKFHDVFHVSLLEPWHSRTETVAKPPPMDVNGHEEWEVKSIQAHRDTKKGRQYLVRWKGYSLAEDTWEPSENLSNAQGLLQDYLVTAPGDITLGNSHVQRNKRGRN